jgi:hypothetical protein
MDEGTSFTATRQRRGAVHMMGACVQVTLLAAGKLLLSTKTGACTAPATYQQNIDLPDVSDSPAVIEPSAHHPRGLDKPPSLPPPEPARTTPSNGLGQPSQNSLRENPAPGLGNGQGGEQGLGHRDPISSHENARPQPATTFPAQAKCGFDPQGEVQQSKKADDDFWFGGAYFFYDIYC